MAENDIVVGTLKQGENDFYPRTSKELVAGMPSALSDLTADSTHRTVTDSEKATWNGKYTIPAGGIPSTDMSSDVQTSLGKADTALQSFTETDPTVPSWAKAQNPPTEIFWATYGTTTASEIAAAISANKLIFVKTSDPNDNIGVLSWYDTAGYYYNFIGGDTVGVTYYKCSQSDSSWSMSQTFFGTYVKPTGGIPKTDLAAAVQSSLEKADGALRYDVTQSLTELQKHRARANIGLSVEIFWVEYGVTPLIDIVENTRDDSILDVLYYNSKLYTVTSVSIASTETVVTFSSVGDGVINYVFITRANAPDAEEIWSTSSSEIPETVQAQEIEIDSTPTANSNNLVTSGGVYAALQGVGIPEAPLDGGAYVRQNGAWSSAAVLVNETLNVVVNTSDSAAVGSECLVYVTYDGVTTSYNYAPGGISVLIPNEKTYTVSVNKRDGGYIPPVAQTFTSVMARVNNVTMTYQSLAYGVYIVRDDMTFWTAENWDTAGNNRAVGVALHSADVTLLIHKSMPANKLMLLNETTTVVSGVEQVSSPYVNTYCGKANTEAFMAFAEENSLDCPACTWAHNIVFPNGEHGFVPSCGELNLILNTNKNGNETGNAISSLFTLIGATTPNPITAAIWSSSQTNNGNAKCFAYWGGPNYQDAAPRMDTKNVLTCCYLIEPS